jgi:hypothetical protein
MKPSIMLVVLCISAAQTGQITAIPGLTQNVSSVESRSRLAALGDLGARTRTSLLVEAGDLAFLQQEIPAPKPLLRFADEVEVILSGPELYKVKKLGKLMVIVPEKPTRPTNRILRLQLGPLSFTGKSISDLNPRIRTRIQQVTGCTGVGDVWTGLRLDLAIPSFSKETIFFENVIEQVANAPEPTMWVIGPDDGTSGCIANPQWEVGFFDSPRGIQGQSSDNRSDRNLSRDLHSAELSAPPM